MELATEAAGTFLGVKEKSSSGNRAGDELPAREASARAASRLEEPERAA